MNAYPRQFRMFKMKTKKQLGDRKYGAMSPAVYFFTAFIKLRRIPMAGTAISELFMEYSTATHCFALYG